MKKITLVTLLLIIITSLTGCNKRLENNYFENTEKNTLEEANELFNDYLSRARSNLDLFYPPSYQERAIYNKDGYINGSIRKDDIIYPSSFINYHLSDDRSYMRYSDLYYLSSYPHSTRSSSNCETIKEGENCYLESVSSEGKTSKFNYFFLMEDDSLVVKNMYTINQNRLFDFTFYFYEENNQDIMEMTILVSNVSQSEYEKMSFTKLIFGVSEESFICNNCFVNNSNEGSLEYIYNELNQDKGYTSNEYDNSKFMHLTLKGDSIWGTVFTKDTGEMFNMAYSIDSNEYNLITYAKYIRNTELVSYSKYTYRVNLLEIPGWDELRPASEGSQQYDLYDNGVKLSNGETIKIITTESEYPYVEFKVDYNNNESFLPKVLDLSVIGLETEYTQAYFNSKTQQGTDLFNQFLTERNLDNTYEYNYDYFRGLIDFDNNQSTVE